MDIRKRIEYCIDTGLRAEAGVLKGCVQMHIATGEERYLGAIKDYTAQYEYGSGSIEDAEAGNALFYLYELTGGKQYESVLKSLTERFKLSGDGPGPEWLCAVLPFYMNYETKFNKKAGYQEIVNRFLGIRHKLSKEENQLNLVSESSYLTALIDTIDVMSIEIFEHYKALEILFKEAVRKIAPGGNPPRILEPAQCTAILKACRIGVLSRERYEAAGDSIFNSSANGIGLLMEACAQKLMLRQI